MGICLIVFMMVLMIWMAYDMHQTVEKLLVAPLERMLSVVRVHAAKIMDQFAMGLDHNEEGGEDSPVSEIEMLEVVLVKLARLAELQMKKNKLSADELANMDEGGKAIMEMMEVKVVGDSTAGAVIAGGFKESAMSKAVNNWKVDVLSMNLQQLQDVIVHIFFTSELGFAGEFVGQPNFLNFHGVVKAGYSDLPYHCYAHACDVLHCCFRILNLVQGQKWLSTTELYGLLIGALCHDLGHFGKTNPFLVETGHDLALRYNDKSPLENMHCAKLFEICKDPMCDVFVKTTPEKRKETRKVCISSILHTDNAHHFQAVSEMGQVYEVNMECCDGQAGSPELRPDYMSEVLQKEKQMWIELFLHFSDVSNPMKPFEICKAWAWRVLDEFFNEGDEQKRLGIPVGMLNDRDKVNRPGSQHGFISFLVAPLVKNTVQVFPALQELHGQLASNLGDWRNVWVEEVQPSDEEQAKKDADVQRLQDLAEELRERNGLSALPTEAQRKGAAQGELA